MRKSTRTKLLGVLTSLLVLVPLLAVPVWSAEEIPCPNNPDGTGKHNWQFQYYDESYSSCLNDAMAHFLCEYCSGEKDDTVPGTAKGGHDWCNKDGICAWNNCRYECPHDGEIGIIPELPPTCSEEGFEEGTYCKICNKTLQREWLPAKEHDWDPDTGKCKRTDCGALCPHKLWNGDDGTCYECGKECDHDWSEGNGQCKICKMYCPHDWDSETGICKDCKWECFHNFRDENGTCMSCGKACDHDWTDKNGVCKTCHKICSHDWNEQTGECKICEKACAHEKWNSETGTCITCGKPCLHDWSDKDGVCKVCHMNCAHANMQGAVCSDCGKQICDHSGNTNKNNCLVAVECSVCHTPGAIPAIGSHDPVPDPAVEATCAPGKTEGSHCGRCGEILVKQETIPAREDHVPFWKAGVDRIEIEATCTTEGKYQDTACIRCGTPMKDLVIPAKGHNWLEEYRKHYTTFEVYRGKVNTTYKTVPTCTEDGQYWGEYCSRCGISEEGAIAPALGHRNTKVISERVEPTCTTVGWTEGVFCEDCGQVIAAPKVIPPLEHSPMGKKLVLKAATCTEDGMYASYVCGGCNQMVEGETIPALGHDFDSASAQQKQPEQLTVSKLSVAVKTGVASIIGNTTSDKNCTNPAKLSADHCQRCGFTAVKTVVGVSEHDHTDARYKKEPTCTEDGIYTDYYCAQCEKIVVGETIPATGHQWKMFRQDKTEYKYCAVCGEYEAYVTTGNDKLMLNPGSEKIGEPILELEEVKIGVDQKLTVEVEEIKPGGDQKLSVSGTLDNPGKMIVDSKKVILG